jgi:FtsZ-binding cell division protein ZapB
MNDTYANNVAMGIMILGDNQRKINSANAEVVDGIEKIGDLTSTNNALASDIVDAQRSIEELKEENDFFRDLLCKPMSEIAQQNRNFNKTFEAQMELLADWMVSQKAFKELAIQFGIEKGLTVNEVVQIGLEIESNVLESKNNPGHNTNADNSAKIRPYIEKLKSKKIASDKGKKLA